MTSGLKGHSPMASLVSGAMRAIGTIGLFTIFMAGPYLDSWAESSIEMIAYPWILGSLLLIHIVFISFASYMTMARDDGTEYPLAKWLLSGAFPALLWMTAAFIHSIYAYYNIAGKNEEEWYAHAHSQSALLLLVFILNNIIGNWDVEKYLAARDQSNATERRWIYVFTIIMLAISITYYVMAVILGIESTKGTGGNLMYTVTEHKNFMLIPSAVGITIVFLLISTILTHSQTRRYLDTLLPLADWLMANLVVVLAFIRFSDELEDENSRDPHRDVFIVNSAFAMLVIAGYLSFSSTIQLLLGEDRIDRTRMDLMSNKWRWFYVFCIVFIHAVFMAVIIWGLVLLTPGFTGGTAVDVWWGFNMAPLIGYGLLFVLDIGASFGYLGNHLRTWILLGFDLMTILPFIMTFFMWNKYKLNSAFGDERNGREWLSMTTVSVTLLIFFLSKKMSEGVSLAFRFTSTDNQRKYTGTTSSGSRRGRRTTSGGGY